MIVRSQEGVILLDRPELISLTGADLSGADLSGANLSGANLSGANLSKADLTGANLTGANLTGANLTRANLTGADLTGADLIRANLSWTILTGAILTEASLNQVNLSGAKGLLDPIDFMSQFESTTKGIIVYKRIGSTEYPLASHWTIESDAVLTETCNPLRTDKCGCGVNFSTLEWCRENYLSSTLWKCLIQWQDAMGIVVPYNTDGKARCSRLTLLEVIND